LFRQTKGEIQCRLIYARGTDININNFLFRVQKKAVKDVQAHLRHTNAKTTLAHYIKSIPGSVRIAVESLDHLLKSRPGTVEGGQAN